MYRVISIRQYQMSRDVILENTATGTQDICFDDSDMDKNGFYFMEVGQEYSCRIKLVGDVVPHPSVERAMCRVLNADVLCGNAHHVEVAVGDDIYYVPRKHVENKLKDGYFTYYYTRKDLVMVNGIVNDHYLLRKP